MRMPIVGVEGFLDLVHPVAQFEPTHEASCLEIQLVVTVPDEFIYSVAAYIEPYKKSLWLFIS